MHIKLFRTEWNRSADSRLLWQGAAPCGPFQRLRCELRPFSILYMCPTAFSDSLYMCPAARSVCVSTSVCVCVCLSVSHLKGFWMRARRNSRSVPKIVKKLTEDQVKIFWRIRCIITGGTNYKRNCMSLKMNENCFVLLVKMPFKIYQKRSNNF